MMACNFCEPRVICDHDDNLLLSAAGNLNGIFSRGENSVLRNLAWKLGAGQDRTRGFCYNFEALIWTDMVNGNRDGNSLII